MIQTHILRMFAFGMAVLSVVVVGCGPSAPKGLTGKISYKGTAAGKVVIRLISPEGTPYEGRTNADGSFEVPSVPEGDYKVAILSMSEGKSGVMTGPAAKRSMGKQSEKDKEKFLAEQEKQKAEYAKGGMNIAKESSSVDLPKKYSNPETSGLTWSTKETKKKDFDLTD